MNLIENIFEQMESDSENFTNKQSEILMRIYKNANKAQAEIIDDVLICLCGWSMKKLIEITEKYTKESEST